MANINFLNTDNCTAVTFNTPTTDLQFIEYILEDPSKDYTNVDKYTITTSTNCCSPGIVTDIAPPYQFNPVINACVSGPVFAVPAGTYDVQLDGINGNLISTFLLGVNGSPQVEWPYVNTSGVVTFEAILGDTVPLGTFMITLTTTSGFTYNIDFDITQDPDPGVSCDGVLSNLAITYPVLPDNIVEVPTALPDQELSINSLFGFEGVDLPAGSYQIIFCEVLEDTSSTCIQNHIFIDCTGSLKCQVVNKWIMCIDSDIMDVYTALTYANDCTDVVTYEEMCALYEILVILLETDGCFGRLDDCNCTDAPTVANKLSPIRYPSPTNNNPCSNC